MSKSKENNNNIPGDIIDFQHMQEVRCDLIDSKYSILRITEYKTSFGQTIYIKTIDKKAEKKIEKSTEKETLLNKTHSFITQTFAEKVLKNELLSRISLRKTMEVIMLRYQGIDDNGIVKQTKLSKEVVNEIVDLFME